MSEISSVNPPYVRGLYPDDEDPEGTLPLKPHHMYKVGLNHRQELTLFSSPAKNRKPSFAEASQLDQNLEAAGVEADGTVLTLVTDEEKPLELGSYFFTDADNTVRFPNRSNKSKIIPYVRRKYTAADGRTEDQKPIELGPNQLVKVAVHPSRLGLCQTHTQSSSKPPTIEMAWKLDPKVILGETMLDGIDFTVVTATEQRVMKPPFTLATNGRIDVTYSEGGPPIVTDDQGNTLCASGNGNKASPTSQGTLLAASASKSGSITPAISRPDSEARSFSEHLSNVNDWYLPSKRTPQSLWSCNSK
jgi:hypothetical protein